MIRFSCASSESGCACTCALDTPSRCVPEPEICRGKHCNNIEKERLNFPRSMSLVALHSARLTYTNHQGIHQMTNLVAHLQAKFPIPSRAFYHPRHPVDSFHRGHDQILRHHVTLHTKTSRGALLRDRYLLVKPTRHADQQNPQRQRETKSTPLAVKDGSRFPRAGCRSDNLFP